MPLLKPDLLLDEIVCSPAQEDHAGEKNNEPFEVLNELVSGGKEIVHRISFPRLKRFVRSARRLLTVAPAEDIRDLKVRLVM